MNDKDDKKNNEEEVQGCCGCVDCACAVDGVEEESDGEKESSEKDLASEYLEGWKRCRADFENYRKEQEAARLAFASYAAEGMVHEIIPVLDNFDTALSHVPEGEKESSWTKGVLHIRRQLWQVLADRGVEEIEIKEGDAFDPTLCEAVSSDEEKKENEKEDKNEEPPTAVVQKVVRKGYKFRDGRLIRPAGVVVG